jgi:hypothetical protein
MQQTLMSVIMLTALTMLMHAYERSPIRDQGA